MKYLIGTDIGTSGTKSILMDTQGRLIAQDLQEYDVLTPQLQFFFPNSNAEKSTGRRQLDALLDGMSDKGIRIVTATAREITEVEKAED